MVCTGNICRSPIAELMLKDKLSRDSEKVINISSAGINGINNNRATKKAIETMNEHDIDLSDHRARFLTYDILKESDLVLVMERAQLKLIHNLYRSEKDKVYLLSTFCPEKKKIDVPDPYGQSIKVYKKSAALIEKCLNGVVEYLRQDKRI